MALTFGLEPKFSASKADVLPLDDTSMVSPHRFELWSPVLQTGALPLSYRDTWHPRMDSNHHSLLNREAFYR